MPLRSIHVRGRSYVYQTSSLQGDVNCSHRRLWPSICRENKKQNGAVSFAKTTNRIIDGTFRHSRQGSRNPVICAKDETISGCLSCEKSAPAVEIVFIEIELDLWHKFSTCIYIYIYIGRDLCVNRLSSFDRTVESFFERCSNRRARRGFERKSSAIRVKFVSARSTVLRGSGVSLSLRD